MFCLYESCRFMSLSVSSFGIPPPCTQVAFIALLRVELLKKNIKSLQNRPNYRYRRFRYGYMEGIRQWSF